MRGYMGGFFFSLAHRRSLAQREKKVIVLVIVIVFVIVLVFVLAIFAIQK